MTSKGQITVPKDVRDDLELVEGSRVLFVKVGEGHYRLVGRTGALSDLAGVLRRPGQEALTVEEMQDGIAEAAAAAGAGDDEPGA
ncbi:MAG: AbrB/MazE/SpoVT family DNA-binding domain-containing protein [Actinomycetales bacterium]|nr:AbrB/MazE/SpoVT family DNA-binding domain-containing protein [Actinomycetales bacterium]